MATPNRYITLELTLGERKQAVTGYRVIGDYVENGVWYVTLQRPESGQKPKVTRKPKAKAATPQSATGAQEGAS